MPASPPASCGRGPGSVAFPGQQLSAVNQHFPVRGWHRATTTVPPPGTGNVPPHPKGGQGSAWHLAPMAPSNPFPGSSLRATACCRKAHFQCTETHQNPPKHPKILPHHRHTDSGVSPLLHFTKTIGFGIFPVSTRRLGRGRSRGASPQPPSSVLPARSRARAGSRWSLSARPHGTARGSWAWQGTARLLRLRCPAPARAPRPHSHPPGEFGLPQGHMPAMPGLSHVTQAGDTHTC